MQPGFVRLHLFAGKFSVFAGTQAFPYEGKVARRSRDGWGGGISVYAAAPTSSVTTSPYHLPLIGEGIEVLKKLKIPPQKGAV